MSEFSMEERKKWSVPFCSCVDTACPNHPANHKLGCTPCIAKCIAKDEIPTCFFRKIEPDMSRDQDYTFAGFARFVLTGKSKEEESAK